MNDLFQKLMKLKAFFLLNLARVNSLQEHSAARKYKFTKITIL